MFTGPLVLWFESYFKIRSNLHMTLSWYLTGLRIPRNCFANLVTELSQDIHASVARVWREFSCVGKVLNMFRNFMQIVLPKYVARLLHQRLCECHEPVASNLQCENFTTLVRMSYHRRGTVLRKHPNNS